MGPDLPYDDDEEKHTLGFLKSELGHQAYLNYHEKDQLVLLKNFVISSNTKAEKLNDAFHRHIEQMGEMDRDLFRTKVLANQLLKEKDNPQKLNSWVWLMHASSNDAVANYYEKNNRQDFFFTDGKEAQEMVASMQTFRLLKVIDFHLSSQHPLATGHWNTGKTH